MEKVEVWVHARTGEFFVVGNEGATVFGPVGADEVLHQYRCASAPCESKKASFYEVFATFDNPYPPSEFVKHDVADLAPSVTEELVPDDIHAFVDFFPNLEQARIDEVRKLAQASSTTDGLALATIGRLTAPFRSHPAGSIVLCPRIVPGETMTVVEWP